MRKYAQERGTPREEFCAFCFCCHPVCLCRFIRDGGSYHTDANAADGPFRSYHTVAYAADGSFRSYYTAADAADGPFRSNYADANAAVVTRAQ